MQIDSIAIRPLIALSTKRKASEAALAIQGKSRRRPTTFRSATEAISGIRNSRRKSSWKKSIQAVYFRVSKVILPGFVYQVSQFVISAIQMHSGSRARPDAALTIPKREKKPLIALKR